MTSPAGAAVMVTAAAPGPVTNLAVGTVNQGPNQSWVVPVSWTASAGATGYTVTITNTSDTATYATDDTTDTTDTLTTSGLEAGFSYHVSVTPKNVDGDGAPLTTSFTAPALDIQAPTGTFTVAPTQAWLMFDIENFGTDKKASVTITQGSVSDNSGGSITREVLAGDGTAAVAWPSGTSIAVTYTKAGTFTPQVRLTDQYGNVGTVSLSPVTISNDSTAPVVHITRPASAMRSRIAGWRVIHGTATDTGTGVQSAAVMVLQKRSGVWYAYSFGSHKWLKGRAGELATVQHVHAMPAFVTVNSLNQWHTPTIRGLRTGEISVRAFAFDGAFNDGRAPVVRQLITRS
jgi:hypothetical protein